MSYDENNREENMYTPPVYPEQPYPEQSYYNAPQTPPQAAPYPPPAYTTQPIYDAPPAYAPPPAYGASPVYEVPPSYEAMPAYDTPPAYEAAPAYETQSSSEQYMYTPGIGMNQPLPRERTVQNPRSNSKRGNGSAAGRFLRAAGLVLACSAFSAAAAYLVTDYRFSQGDFTPTTNQVVLGGRPSESSVVEDPYPAPQVVHLPDSTITAQDIYDIALTQVVGVSMATPQTSGGIFGWPGTQQHTLVPSVVGSGFIISEDGYLLTNYHVIEMAHVMDLPISVVMHDGASYDAEIIGFEASSDVAVLKIDATGLNAALIGNSDALRVGQSVYAVGNPFGDLVYTMTDGIVSALDRVVSVDGKTISAFQFSAAVNSGNSGGPVYNTSGEIIGIVTAKVIRGNVEGIGFAIPINDAIDIAAALIEYGYISGRPLLGVTVETITPQKAAEDDLVAGVGIREVNPGSAAEKAGLLIGDIITAIGEKEVDSIETLRFALRTFRADETAILTVWRDGKILEMPITFDEDLGAGRPDPTAMPNIDDIPNPFGD